MHEANSINDLYDILDRLTDGVDWNDFYARRAMPAPFLVHSTLPDKAVTQFVRTHDIKSAVEFGCGEGRNAIFLARNGVDVLALDSSQVAVENARSAAQNTVENLAAHLDFVAADCLAFDYKGRTFDLALDSGLFHHLAPHRRLQYRDLLGKVLNPGGFFVLLCFAANAGGADEADDLGFYLHRNTGVAFTEQRIRDFFGADFQIVSIEKCAQSVTDDYIDIPFLFSCIMQKK